MRVPQTTAGRPSAPVAAVAVATVTSLGILAGCGSGGTGAETASGSPSTGSPATGSPSTGLAQGSGSAAPPATETVTDTTTAAGTNTATDTTMATQTNRVTDTMTVTTTAAPGTPTPTQTEKVSGDGAATASAPARLVDLRVGKHASFDRIVLDFDADPGVPAWQVDYVEPPFHRLGSGKPVKDMAGQVFLRIDLSHIGPPADAVPDRMHPELPAIYDVATLGTFEGQSSIGIGVQSRHGAPQHEPFRAFRDGDSLVVDVAHP